MNKKSFEYNSILLFILMMAANVCNYLFQIVVAWLINDAEKYAIINTLISIESVLLIPNTLMIMVTAKYTALYYAKNQYDSFQQVIHEIFRYAKIIVLFMVIISVFTVPILTKMFKLQNDLYIWLVVVTVDVLVLSSVYVGVLQGKQEFFHYGIQNLINVVSKLLFSIVFVLIGYKILGVLAALLLGAVFVFMYSYIVVNKYIGEKNNEGKNNEGSSETESIRKTIYGTFIFQLTITLLTNGDMLIVKALFSDYTAGVYSSAMVIGKIPLYVSGAIVGTLFPMVAAEYALGKDTKPLLKKAFIYGGGITILCSAILVLFRKFIFSILFRQTYGEAVNYLPAICIFVVPLTLLTIISNFLMALGKSRIVSISLCSCCGISLVVSFLLRNNINMLIMGIAMVMLLTFIFDFFCAMKTE